MCGSRAPRPLRNRGQNRWISTTGCKHRGYLFPPHSICHLHAWDFHVLFRISLSSQQLKPPVQAYFRLEHIHHPCSSSNPYLDKFCSLFPIWLKMAENSMHLTVTSRSWIAYLLYEFMPNACQGAMAQSRCSINTYWTKSPNVNSHELQIKHWLLLFMEGNFINQIVAPSTT